MSGPILRVRRRCDLGYFCNPPHTWERLNPITSKPYHRGRVVFLCPWVKR